MPTASPLVPRGVRSGGLLLVIGALQFVVAMILVQQHYPGYSLTRNYISDLGGTHSPWALVFDASAILLGVLGIPAVFLVWDAFDPGAARPWGLLLLLVAAVGVIAVGVFPETTSVLHGGAHTIASFVTFVGAAFGLIALSFAMRRPPHWSYSGPYTLVSGVVSLAAIALFATGFDLGIGPGGMERLIVAPVLLWLIVVGLHLAILHRFAPGLRLPHASA